MCHFPNQDDYKDGGSEEEDLRRCLEHPEPPACSPSPSSLPPQGFCSSCPGGGARSGPVVGSLVLTDISQLAEAGIRSFFLDPEVRS